MDDTRDRVARVMRRMELLDFQLQRDLIWDEARAQYEAERDAGLGGHNPLLILDVFENALDMLDDGALAAG